MSSVPPRLSGGRLAYERAIRRSSLPAPARHLALTIATWADVETGVIPDRYQPSISTLAEATGMGASTVKRHLGVLEDEGWIGRERPDLDQARREHARTQYVLGIPAGFEGHGPERAMPRVTAGQAHGPERAKAWPTAGHKSPSQSREVPLSLPTDPKPPTVVAGSVEEREKPAATDDRAGAVVAAYIEAIHRPVTSATRTKLLQQAAQLLADGFPAAWLADRARELAERGWTDLALHCERSTVPTQRVATDSRADWCGECIDPHHRLIKDPARDNELVPCEACHPAAVARRRRAETGEAA